MLAARPLVGSWAPCTFAEAPHAGLRRLRPSLVACSPRPIRAQTFHSTSLRRQPRSVIIQEDNPHNVEPLIEAGEGETIREPRIWPQALFALLFGSAAFALAAEQTNETTASQQQKLAIHRASSLSRRLMGGSSLESNSIELAVARKAEMQMRIRNGLARLRASVMQPVYRGCALIGEYWSTASESKMTCVPLLAVLASSEGV